MGTTNRAPKVTPTREWWTKDAADYARPKPPLKEQVRALKRENAELRESVARAERTINDMYRESRTMRDQVVDLQRQLDYVRGNGYVDVGRTDNGSRVMLRTGPRPRDEADVLVLEPAPKQRTARTFDLEG